MADETTNAVPDCDICGQPRHRHVQICGAGLVCPVSAVTYRPHRLTAEQSKQAEIAQVVAFIRPYAEIFDHYGFNQIADAIERRDYLTKEQPNATE